MSTSNHAVVWVDHDEAKVYRVDNAEPSHVRLHSHASVQRLHHRQNPDPRAPAPVDAQYFDRIAGALVHAGSTLITGPGNAKFELQAYLRQYRPKLPVQVHARDMIPHPGEAALLAAARTHFLMEA